MTKLKSKYSKASFPLSRNTQLETEMGFFKNYKMLRNKFKKKMQSLIGREEGKIPYSILLKVIKLDQSVRNKQKKNRKKG